MRSSRFIGVFLVAVIAALVAAGIYTYETMRAQQQSLRSIERYDIVYSAHQAVIELVRFENTLLHFDRERGQGALDEVKLKFEILYNRAAMMSEGEFQRFVIASGQRERLVASFQETIRRIDPLIINAGLDVDIAPMLADIQPFKSRLLGLAAEANEHGAKHDYEERRELSRMQSWFAAATFGLIVCGFALVSVLTWHNRLLMRAHRSLSRTTRDLEKTAADLSAANEAVAAANSELRVQNNRLLEKEDALRAQNVLFNAALNNISQGLCMFDDDLRPLVRNDQFDQLFDVSREQAGPASRNEDHPNLRDIAPEFAVELEANVRLGRAADFEVDCDDGRIVEVEQRPMPDGGWVATFEDVTEERRIQARIAHMARHDGLTDLPNRYAFRERIQEALDASHATDSMLAVMCLDLDNFKEVNDSLGHPTGDALLCAVAERLVGCVRDSDMVARFGGDEFAILQPHVERVEDAERLASRIIDMMRRPFLIKGELVYSTGSVGIALSPHHGNDPVALQKNADLALYAAKSEGRRTYRFFRNEMDEQLTHRHELERDLRQAIAANQLHLHYQPIMHLRTMQTVGFEALLRWNHPVHGAVPPSTFIPVAEDTGLITGIGRWVLAQACADAARWPDYLKLSVNLSPAQFVQADIVQDISEALSRAGLRPDRLIVEITESLFLTEGISTFNTLGRLKALGIEVAMDDFGTGYSSLSYLRKYPFDRIKIDRDFVNAAGHGEKSAAIIQTIVQLGSALGMITVAEGVETEKDLAMLIAAGCPEGQGYLFSDPVPSAKVLELIQAGSLAAYKVA